MRRPCSSSTWAYRTWCFAVSICHWPLRCSTTGRGFTAMSSASSSHSCATVFWPSPSSPFSPLRSIATSWSATRDSTQSKCFSFLPSFLPSFLCQLHNNFETQLMAAAPSHRCCCHHCSNLSSVRNNKSWNPLGDDCLLLLLLCVCVCVSVPIYLLIRSSGKKKRKVKSLSPEHCPFPETVYNLEQQ